MTEPVSALESEAAMRALMVASTSAYNVLEGGADDTTELRRAVAELADVLRGTDVHGAAQSLLEVCV